MAMADDSNSIKLRVNGREVDVAVAAGAGERSLLEVLREDFALTGTKYGCGEGACGACSVLVDGKRIFSCSTEVSRLAGKSVTTIEGLGKGGAHATGANANADRSGAESALHPVQQAFLDAGAFQCGYCTPGMIVAAVALLERKPNPSDDEIRDGMNGNICRCCGYDNIRAAVKSAATALARK